MKQVWIIIIVATFFIQTSFAGILEDKVEIDNIKNLERIRAIEASKNKTYSFELNEGGVYIEPQIKAINGATNNLEQQNISNVNNQSQPLNYQVKSNIGVDFNKYFTGFLAYDLGSVAINPASKNVDFGINSSTIRVNGVGSKINFSDDFNLKIMYFEQDRNIQNQNINRIDRNQEIHLKTTITF